MYLCCYNNYGMYAGQTKQSTCCSAEDFRLPCQGEGHSRGMALLIYTYDSICVHVCRLSCRWHGLIRRMELCGRRTMTCDL